jgi:hypothetical protein
MSLSLSSLINMVKHNMVRKKSTGALMHTRIRDYRQLKVEEIKKNEN